MVVCWDSPVPESVITGITGIAGIGGVGGGTGYSGTRLYPVGIRPGLLTNENG